MKIKCENCGIDIDKDKVYNSYYCSAQCYVKKIIQMWTGRKLK